MNSSATTSLVSASQNATGALQAAQAGNQLPWNAAARACASFADGPARFGESLRSMSVDRSRAMIELGHPRLSAIRQCAPVSIGRSTFYRAPDLPVSGARSHSRSTEPSLCADTTFRCGAASSISVALTRPTGRPDPLGQTPRDWRPDMPRTKLSKAAKLSQERGPPQLISCCSTHTPLSRGCAVRPVCWCRDRRTRGRRGSSRTACRCRPAPGSPLPSPREAAE